MQRWIHSKCLLCIRGRTTLLCLQCSWAVTGPHQAGSRSVNSQHCTEGFVSTTAAEVTTRLESMVWASSMGALADACFQQEQQEAIKHGRKGPPLPKRAHRSLGCKKTSSHTIRHHPHDKLLSLQRLEIVRAFSPGRDGMANVEARSVRFAIEIRSATRDGEGTEPRN